MAGGLVRSAASAARFVETADFVQSDCCRSNERRMLWGLRYTFAEMRSHSTRVATLPNLATVPTMDRIATDLRRHGIFSRNSAFGGRRICRCPSLRA